MGRHEISVLFLGAGDTCHAPYLRNYDELPSIAKPLPSP